MSVWELIIIKQFMFILFQTFCQSTYNVNWCPFDTGMTKFIWKYNFANLKSYIYYAIFTDH